MKNFLDALARVKTPEPTPAAEAPKTWLDGSSRAPGVKDSKGFPVDLERARTEFPYFVANRDAVLAERSRLALEQKQTEEDARFAEQRRARDEAKRRDEATKQVDAEAAAAAEAERSARIAEREAAIAAAMETNNG